MTGSHEVRGSIPLGSTNIFNNLGHPSGCPLSFGCLCCATEVSCFKRWGVSATVLAF